jgi:hypothetical protein
MRSNKNKTNKKGKKDIYNLQHHSRPTARFRLISERWNSKVNKKKRDAKNPVNQKVEQEMKEDEINKQHEASRQPRDLNRYLLAVRFIDLLHFVAFILSFSRTQGLTITTTVYCPASERTSIHHSYGSFRIFNRTIFNYPASHGNNFTSMRLTKNGAFDYWANGREVL